MTEKETKTCPYCGETILAIAKKCRYCGEWLDKPEQETKKTKRCPVCGEEIDADAIICPECHENIAEYEKRQEEKTSKPHYEEDIEEEKPGWMEYFFYQPFIKHYFDFKSAIGRKRFWICMVWSALFYNAIMGVTFLLVDKNITFLDSARTMSQIGLIYTVLTLVIIIPALSLYVRRLRDAELSWKWVLSLLIPYIGLIILIVKLCKAGNQECIATKGKSIDYISIVVCSLLIVFGYSQGVSYMIDAVKMWQKYPSTLDAPDLTEEDSVAVDTIETANQEGDWESNGSNESTTTNENDYDADEYAWLCTRQAEPEDLTGKSNSELRIMRNYIFARHGYIFNSEDLTQYFSQYNWYTPTSRNVTDDLSQIEKYNIKLIESYER